MTAGHERRHDSTAESDAAEAFKVLGHPMRLQILEWLSDPEKNFAEFEPIADRAVVGACVTHIQAKSGLPQSTTSTHLSALEQVGLVHATRVGKWMHYRRDDERLRALVRSLPGGD